MMKRSLGAGLPRLGLALALLGGIHPTSAQDAPPILPDGTYPAVRAAVERMLQDDPVEQAYGAMDLFDLARGGGPDLTPAVPFLLELLPNRRYLQLTESRPGIADKVRGTSAAQEAMKTLVAMGGEAAAELSAAVIADKDQYLSSFLSTLDNCISEAFGQDWGRTRDAWSKEECVQDAFVPAALAGTEYRSPSAREDAVVWMGFHGEVQRTSTRRAELIEVLTRALADPEAGVRSRAVVALGRYGPDAASALPALREATNDPDPLVRSYAWGAIEAIGGGGMDLAETLHRP